MSKTLNLVDGLLAKGRVLHELGRERDALHILNRVCGFRELPADAAEESQSLLAEIHLQNRRYRKARRHLTAALRHQPENARYHRLMASALDNDKKGDAERAAAHYRKSLELDPEQPTCLSDYGSLAVRIGQAEEGLRCLRAAVEKEPSNPSLVERLVNSLRLAGLADEARGALLAARFRNPRDARFRRVCEDYEFQELHREQQAARREKVQREAEEQGPVLLPFVRPPSPTPGPVGRKIIRIDQPAPLPSPHTPRPTHVPDRRRAL